MTDKEKLEKVKAEIERRKKEVEDNIFELGNFESERIGLFDNKEIYNDLLSFIDSMQKEPKECMYSKDNFTDEDRKVLCDGCKEKCKYDKSDDFTKALAECIHNAQCNVVDPMVFAETWKDELIKLSKCEEPVSDDLEEEIGKYCSNPENFITYIDVGFKQSPIEKDDIPLIIKAIKFGANWQEQKDEKNIGELQWNAHAEGWDECKQEMMKDAIDTTIKQGCTELVILIKGLNEDKFSFGDKVKIIVVKED